MKIKVLILHVLFLSLLHLTAFAQGGWDLKYLPLDSLNNSFNGREVRIDFRKTSQDTLRSKAGGWYIYRLLGPGDSITLDIDGQSVKFTESWHIYDDHGMLSEQYLEGASTYQGKSIWIKECFWVSSNDSSIKVKARLYFRKPFYLASKQQQEIVLISIKKSKIKGIVLRLDD
ncbi:hypothetical protein BKI52_20370 [marine bacterium AO1-C]|nr:hypothetical protein BKI52_20370 [marine bacterium AO1-C]